MNNVQRWHKLNREHNDINRRVTILAGGPDITRNHLAEIEQVDPHKAATLSKLLNDRSRVSAVKDRLERQMTLERLAANCLDTDHILAGQLRIEVVNLCNPDQNIELLAELSQCANAAEDITVLLRWKARLNGGASAEPCQRCLELELRSRELLRALEAYQISPGPQVSAWVRMAERDLREALET